jgi:hypothetical protein
MATTDRLLDLEEWVHQLHQRAEFVSDFLAATVHNNQHPPHDVEEVANQAKDLAMGLEKLRRETITQWPWPTRETRREKSLFQHACEMYADAARLESKPSEAPVIIRRLLHAAIVLEEVDKQMRRAGHPVKWWESTGIELMMNSNASPFPDDVAADEEAETKRCTIEGLVAESTPLDWEEAEKFFDGSNGTRLPRTMIRDMVAMVVARRRIEKHAEV